MSIFSVIGRVGKGIVGLIGGKTEVNVDATVDTDQIQDKTAERMIGGGVLLFCALLGVAAIVAAKSCGG